MGTNLIHSGDESHILYIARVSSNQENADPGLLGYLIRNGHWSPFEMVGACVEINTTRDIGRQILRHRSFSFQEFSGRYAEYNDITTKRQIRFKGSSNRQGSVPAQTTEQASNAAWLEYQMGVLSEDAFELYQKMLELGVAP
jgi:thymidylate synthase (FAD)